MILCYSASSGEYISLKLLLDFSPSLNALVNLLTSLISLFFFFLIYSSSKKFEKNGTRSEPM